MAMLSQLQIKTGYSMINIQVYFWITRTLILASKA